MGILDEAIREHLDLKRRHGAAEDEVKQLEDEAFGPPSRPGEPDFPERPAYEAPAGSEEATTVMPTGAGAGSEQAEAMPMTPAEAPQAEPSEPPSEELEAPSGEAEAVEEPQAPAGGDQATFYDQSPEPEPEPELELGDLELELEEDLDEDFEESELHGEAAASPEEQHVGPEAATEPPIESLETVEHHIEATPSEEVPIEEAPSEEVPLEEPPSEELALEDEEDEEEGGDVLEETPEFLRDQPEDDELWFEQGEPKDFDF